MLTGGELAALVRAAVPPRARGCCVFGVLGRGRGVLGGCWGGRREVADTYKKW